MKNIIFLYLLLFNNILSAQGYGDCATALLICDKSTIRLTPQSVAQQNAPNEWNNLPCFENAVPSGDVETESAWVRFTVNKSGSLFFTIRPDIEAHDLDFAVFRLTDGQCDQKIPIRCMAAGDSQFPSLCMGPTGLMPGEMDTTQEAGCGTIGTNNFLAPLQAAAGETFALAINNFNSSAGFEVSFYGTALLGCEPEIFTGLVALEPEKNALRLVPNPLSAGSPLVIETTGEAKGEVLFTLFNLAGALVLRTTASPATSTNTLSLPSDLPKGVYVVTMQSTGGTTISYARLLIF